MRDDGTRLPEPMIRWRGAGSEWVGDELRLRRAEPAEPEPEEEGEPEPAPPPVVVEPNRLRLVEKPGKGNEALACQLIAFAPKSPDSYIAGVCGLSVDRVRELRGGRTP